MTDEHCVTWRGYRNARPKFVEGWWNLVNWNFVNQNLA